MSKKLWLIVVSFAMDCKLANVNDIKYKILLTALSVAL